MDKVFCYPNAVVHIVIPDNYPNKTIHKATEEFMRKVIKERIQNGNKHQTGDIKEKSLLDK
jgi:hypothetical protein